MRRNFYRSSTVLKILSDKFFNRIIEITMFLYYVNIIAYIFDFFNSEMRFL